jgi:hypothetical protein
MIDDVELLKKLQELADAVAALRRSLPNANEEIDHHLTVIFTVLHGIQIEATLANLLDAAPTVGRGH